MKDITTDPGLSAVREVVPQWRPSATLSALQDLIDVAAAVPASVARRADLSTSELHALRHLSVAPIGPAELARSLGITSAAASGVVDRLVAHGHVVRRPHPLDGRRTEVHLTEAGRAEVIHRLAPMFAALAALDQSLGQEERVAVDRFLAGATAAIKTLL